MDENNRREGRRRMGWEGRRELKNSFQRREREPEILNTL